MGQTFSEKYIRGAGVIETAGRRVKRYHVSADGGEIPGGIHDAAYRFLPRLLPGPDGEAPPAGWVVLHKGAAVPAYLVAYSWTWGNVVECRAAVAGIPELGCADENPENFTILDRPEHPQPDLPVQTRLQMSAQDMQPRPLPGRAGQRQADVRPAAGAAVHDRRIGRPRPAPRRVLED